MQAGQTIGIWLHDDAARRLVGAAGAVAASRWLLVGTVSAEELAPIGVWVDVDHMVEWRVKRAPGPRLSVDDVARFQEISTQKVIWTVTAGSCLIRWDYIITAQLVRHGRDAADFEWRARDETAA